MGFTVQGLRQGHGIAIVEGVNAIVNVYCGESE